MAELIDFPGDKPAPIDIKDRLRPTPFVWVDPSDLPKRQWLYGRHLIRKFVSTTIAPGGLGKSSLIIVEALAMASGRGLLGEYVPKPLRVWYWNGEDGQDENRYRTVAAAAHHRLRSEDFASRLWQDTGREKEIVIGDTIANRFVVNAEAVDEIIHHIVTNQIDVLIIDPFVAAHNVSENDNGAINAIVRALARIAEFGNCAIELVHHIRKPGAGITSDTDVNDARGASALIGGVRSARVLNVMSADEAERLEIKNRFAHFRVDNGKSNLAPRSENALWRRIVGFDLQNYEGELLESDTIGVVEKWEMPGLFAGTPPDCMLKSKAIISKGDYRHDVRADEWVGYAIAGALEIDCTTDDGRKRIQKIVDKWIENGEVQKVMRPDAQRHNKPFLTAENPYGETDYDCVSSFD